jgi:hypothetical protein
MSVTPLNPDLTEPADYRPNKYFPRRKKTAKHKVKS